MDNGMRGSGLIPLSPQDVDFANETQAFDFLQEVLDDSILQVIGNTYAVYFWYGIVAVVAFAALANVVQFGLHKRRLKRAARDVRGNADDKHYLSTMVAALTATLREISYPQLTPLSSSAWVKIPPLGTIILLVSYLVFVLGLEFVNNDVAGAQHYTALGVRAAWLALAQVPLLILLAGKNNLIGHLTGTSYERLNVLHRWVARMTLLLATLHFGYQSYGWNEYGLTQLEWQTDTCPSTGIAAFAVLLWINISTLAPIRDWSYEFFVVQHLLSFFAFIVTVMYHIPSTALHARIWIWIPIGLYVLDRLIRAGRLVLHNATRARATLTSVVEGSVTKVHIRKSGIKKWRPGSFILLSLPQLGLGQSHPATILSMPSSHGGDLVCVLKSHRGFTRRILQNAGVTSSEASLLPTSSEKPEETTDRSQSYRCFIDGPYGGAHSDFAAFDTVLLIAGATGATFTTAVLLDLAHRASSEHLPVRHVYFVWMVKSRSWTNMLADELDTATSRLEDAGIACTVDVRVTCMEEYLDDKAATRPCCGCGTIAGSCCCDAAAAVDVEDAGDTLAISSTSTRRAPSSQIAVKSGVVVSSANAIEEVAGSTDRRGSSLICTAGRPDLDGLVWDVLDGARGETGVAVCGPLGLNVGVRNAVARASDARAVGKGTGAHGVYLHVEGFSL